MRSVTVQSSRSPYEVVHVPFASLENLFIARQIGYLITQGVATGALTPVSSTGSNDKPHTLPGGHAAVYFQDLNKGESHLPPGYNDVVDIAAHSTVFGSGGTKELILSGNGGLTFVAGAGSGSVDAGGGKNDIDIKKTDTGPWLIATGDANDTIRALGKGNDTISPGGGKNIVYLGSGKDLITLAGHDSIFAGSGHDTINAKLGQATYIKGYSADITFIGGVGPATLLGGSGSDTVYGDSGKLIVHGGTAGHNLLYGGIGHATLYGGGGGDRLYAQGDESQKLIAGAGNETLSAAAAAGHVTLEGSSGKTTMVGAGSYGNDTFAFLKGHGGGKDFVSNFDSSTDKVFIDGNHITSEKVTAGSLTITLSDNTKITFHDVTSIPNKDIIK